MIDICQNSNENKLEYVCRIVKAKSNGIIDLDYTELFVQLFNVELSSTEARKRFYGLKMFVELIENEEFDAIKDVSILDKLELQRIEFEKEKMKFQDQRREFTKLIRETARFEHIKDEFIKAIKETDDIIPIDFKVREYTSSEKHGVLLLSDWHTGLKADNYWNKYNVEEMYKRINKLIDKVIKYGTFQNIETLHLFGLGDFINGLIHVSTRVASEEDVIKQTKRVAETLAKMIAKFANHFKSVEFHFVSGNHGRAVPNKTESIGENFEDFIPWYLEAKLDRLENVKLHENAYDEGIIVGNVLGYNCFGVHGDKDKITSVTQDLSLMLKIIPHYVFTADKHHLEENEIHGVEVIINRSLSGVDIYAKDIRKTSYAGQCFMIFNKDEGRECTYNIKLN